MRGARCRRVGTLKNCFRASSAANCTGTLEAMCTTSSDTENGSSELERRKAGDSPSMGATSCSACVMVLSSGTFRLRANWARSSASWLPASSVPMGRLLIVAVGMAGSARGTWGEKGFASGPRHVAWALRDPSSHGLGAFWHHPAL